MYEKKSLTLKKKQILRSFTIVVTQMWIWMFQGQYLSKDEKLIAWLRGGGDPNSGFIMPKNKIMS